MKEKAGNEDEQDRAAGEDVGQHPFRVGGKGPAAQAIAVADDDKDNGDAAVVAKGGEKHAGRCVEGWWYTSGPTIAGVCEDADEDRVTK